MSDLVPSPILGRIFRAEWPVRLGDVNEGGRLRLDAIARYFQDVSGEDSADAALVGADDWVVRRLHMRVSSFPVFRERLSISTWCGGIGSHYAERRVSILGNRGGAIEAAALWVHIDRRTGRPRRLPSEFSDLYGQAAGGRPVSARLMHSEPPSSLVEVAPQWPLRVTDFDVLGHVNNAACWEPVEEVLWARGYFNRSLRADVEHRAPIEPGANVQLVANDLADDVLSMWLVVNSRVAVSAQIHIGDTDASDP